MTNNSSRRRANKALALAAAALVGLAAVSAVNAAPATRPSDLITPPPKAIKAELAVSAGRRNIVEAIGVRERTVVYKQDIDISKVDSTKKNVIWTRLNFDLSQTKLRKGAATGKWGAELPGDVIKITSVQDGAVQYLNAETLAQWSGHSAFFNGNKVTVELISDPTASANETPSVVISSVVINDEFGGNTDPIALPPPNSLCNAADLRKPSTEKRSGRLFPVGCTGWVIDDTAGCGLTAGHCFDGVETSELVLQMNVPLSAVITSSGVQQGIPRQPKPEDQYAVDPSSVQFELIGGPDEERGRDWGYFGTFRNPNTGKTYREAAGGSYELIRSGSTGISTSIAKPGTSLTINGYGIVRDRTRQSGYLAQQVGSGTFLDKPNSTHFRHRIDTEGGNSGSAVVLTGTSKAIGIHTNGGCSTSSRRSGNSASTINQPGLIRALNAPKGVCRA
ncbi:hypothetical protein BCR44DRAFT_34128 [Catenaria anguillulae PL171]|uniref:Serine protease n=1 Tax=Catenaria anguillulae PL171 TaxID=765915 RepID=A0A1Y2HX79_9FUNG|nr:hypothetical protein BCR44DRAFT_34128 [Catenaria anguillulae PL171]